MYCRGSARSLYRDNRTLDVGQSSQVEWGKYTELLLARSKYGIASFGSSRPSLRLGAYTVTASEHVRLLGVMISSDVSLENYVAAVCSQCSHWLRQLKRVRLSLDACRVDENTCTCFRDITQHSPCWITEEPHWQTATCSERSCTNSHCSYQQVWSTSSSTQLLNGDLHWLDVSQRVLYKLALTVHWCLQHKAPQYLLNYCVPVSAVDSRQHLRSATQHQPLLVPWCRRSTFNHAFFPSVRPWLLLAHRSRTHWQTNCELTNLYSGDRFKAALKAFLFARYQRPQRIRAT